MVRYLQKSNTAYRVLEYIESTGTQYINTGIVPSWSKTYNFKTSVSYTNPSQSEGYVIGAWFLNRFQPIGLYQNKNVGGLGANPNWTFYSGALSANTWYSYNVTMTNNSQNFNGTNTTFNATGNVKSLYLFACNGGEHEDMPKFFILAKVKRILITEDNILIRDMVPVKRMSDDAIGMYDKVNNVFYGNQGTGTFTAGAEIGYLKNIYFPTKFVKPYYCEVEYLESTGTQYIDTGIQYNVNNKYLIKGLFSNSNSQSYHGWNGGGIIGLNPSGLLSVGAEVFGPNAVNKKCSFEQLINQGADSTTSTNYDLEGSTGTLTRAHASLAVFASTGGYCLFAAHSQSSRMFYVQGKGYFFKIWVNDVLVRDFIPVLDWNRVPCMYDKVSGKLFYNKGTGTFTYGREIHYVKYLESTGTQYINTGVSFSSISRLECKSCFMNKSGDQAIFGAATASSTAYNTFIGIVSSGTFEPYIFSQVGGVAPTIGTILKDTKVHSYVYDTSSSLHTFSVDSNSYSISTPYAYSSSSCTLFARNIDGTVNRFASARIYYFKVYKSGILAQDYLPAIDEDGVGFMFDKVAHTIYDNAGTGAFVYPSEQKAPPVFLTTKKYELLEYLQSSGTQYIDTGVIGNGNTKVQLRYQYTQTSTSAGSGRLFGSRVDWNNRAFWLGSSSGTIELTTQYACGYGNTNANSSNNKLIDLNIHTLELSKDGWYIDGVKYANYTYTEFTTPSTMILFGFNNNGTVSVGYNRYYYCKIWSNNILVRDFIPARRVSDNALGMYDKVSGKFYTNQGSGSFTGGDVVGIIGY